MVASSIFSTLTAYMYLSDPSTSILMPLQSLHYVSADDSSIVDDHVILPTSLNMVTCPISLSHPLAMYWSRPT
jgi:hypothetical protein